LVDIPEWIAEWISKDRLVASKFRISQKYLRRSKRIQFSSGDKNDDESWKSFHYIIHSAKFGKYNVRYESGIYHCNCPFFKHRKICSHILGVAQLTNTWPDKKSIFNPD